jgi:hypothetical protein
MTQIHLDVIATVPRASQCDFIDAAMQAKLSCPISRLLNANISMRANLKRRLNGARPQPAKRARKGGPSSTRNGKSKQRPKD